jgi:hypothetical protein
VGSDLTERLSAAASSSDSAGAGFSEDELIDVARTGTVFQRELACELLGGFAGSKVADAELARTFAEANEAQVRAAALGSLVELRGSEATPLMVVALEDKSPWLSEVGAAALAARGDQRGWEPALSKLQALLRTKRRSSRPSRVLPLVCYLLKHPSADGQDRLVAVLRRRWAFLSDPERWWFERHWPSAAPGNEMPAPDDHPGVAVLDEWLAATADQSPRF